MGKGKAAAQCCHACLKSYKKLQKADPQLLEQWYIFIYIYLYTLAEIFLLPCILRNRQGYLRPAFRVIPVGVKHRQPREHI